MKTAFLITPIGTLKLKGNESGLGSVSFVDSEENVHAIVPEVLKKPIEQLSEYFEGSRSSFDVKLNPEGTEFQKKVWKKLMEIPFGKTATYQDIANRLNNPKVIRAAASANGKNPIAVIIPCHRVIGSDGSLTGYAGGLHRKKWLLDHENPVIQHSLF